MREIRIALKYCTLGLLLGLLFAPRPGSETRQALLDRLTDWLDRALGAEQPTTV